MPCRRLLKVDYLAISRVDLNLLLSLAALIPLLTALVVTRYVSSGLHYLTVDDRPACLGCRALQLTLFVTFQIPRQLAMHPPGQLQTGFRVDDRLRYLAQCASR